MTTNYNNSPFDRFNRTKRSRAPLPAVLIAAGLMLAIVGALLWRSGAQSALWDVLAPVVAVRNALSGGEVAQLRAELASTSAAVAERDVLAQQNATLKGMLGRAPQGARLVLVGVLQSPPASAYDNLVIDAGSAQGIAVGDRVLAGGDTFIGTVSRVGDATSVVTLLSAPGSAHDALLLSKESGNTTPLSVAGQGAGTFTAQLPANVPVRPGDSVVFAGVDAPFVAQVIAVNTEPGASFIDLYLRMPVNIFSLQFMLVEKK